MRHSFLFFLLLISTLTSTFAQIHNPVKWSHEYKQVSDTEFDLIFKATIDNGWSIYSQYLESDDGPIRTSFEFEKGSHFSLKGKNEESGDRHEGFDHLFDMNVIKFKKKAIFTQRVVVTDFSKPITGFLEFMTCDATKCLPPDQIDFEFIIEKKAATGGTPPKTEDKGATKTEASKTDPKKEAQLNNLQKASDKAEDKVLGKKDGTTANAQENKQDVRGTDNSQILDPVKWTLTTKPAGENEYDLTFTANIDKGWYVYSQFLESEDGPVKTSFEFQAGDHFSLKGNTKESGEKIEGFDKFFNMKVVKFKKEAIFQQRISVADKTKAVNGAFEYMTCDDTRCLPPAFIPFRFDATSGQIWLGEEVPEEAEAVVVPGVGNGNTSFASRINGNVIDQEVMVIKKTYETPIGDCGEEDNAKGQNFFWTFIMGFLGGLLALLTPCVFPMIPLTVSYFTKGSKDRASGIRNGLIYGLCIIFIYVAIGLLITAVLGPTALNELSTNWIANTLFFLIFIAFAFSFFGFYEITLPSSWSSKSDSMADKGGFIGTFFMAFTLALVSFSCTGPIIGSAIVQSATDALGPFVVMLGFSTALALPFGLFAAFPAWLNSLPKSGGWMNSVKVVLGFLELALALKFLSVADMTSHWGFLKYELFMGLWVLIFAAMTLYLFGFIKFPHDSPVKKLSATRWGFSLASLALTIYLASGFMISEKTKVYDPLSAMSGLAPPAHYNFFLPVPEANKTIKERFPSFTKCANDLDCFKDYYEGVAYAKETNKPILLDFTGYGCVNCRKTEEHIWVKSEVWEKINTDFVLISLYVDDREELNDVLVSKHTQKKIRNVGNKWADFQIVNFQQNSQPLYVMMNPNEEVLAKPRGYKEGVADYANFLDCGLKTYKGSKPTGLN
jgi:thiol:disulfide interchange protein